MEFADEMSVDGEIDPDDYTTLGTAVYPPGTIGGPNLDQHGESILIAWSTKNSDRLPNKGELLALSVASGATETSIVYWLSAHQRSYYSIPTALPI